MSGPSHLAIDDMHIVDFGDRRLREGDFLRRVMRAARTPQTAIPTRDDLVRDAALMRGCRRRCGRWRWLSAMTCAPQASPTKRVVEGSHDRVDLAHGVGDGIFQGAQRRVEMTVGVDVDAARGRPRRGPRVEATGHGDRRNRRGWGCWGCWGWARGGR